MIKLMLGSIFDAKCDLLIIPCDNRGGTTYSIQNELMQNKVYPIPRSLMPKTPGEVVFSTVEGLFSNAAFIGYAASVDSGTIKTLPEYLELIASNIISFCNKNSLFAVNLPLLGSGAGGLSPSMAFESLKKGFKNAPEISVNLFIIDHDVYSALQLLLPSDKNVEAIEIHNPRVFISYTSADYNNRKWVQRLADKLRASGVNARVDIYHLKPGDDLPQWMTNELILAEKVILVCDKFYADKADHKRGGVGWETMIIQGDMMAHLEQSKYVAIARGHDVDQNLPIYVKSRYALDWSDDDSMDKEFDKLLLYLFDCELEPPIGKIPEFIQDLKKLKKQRH